MDFFKFDFVAACFPEDTVATLMTIETIKRVETKEDCNNLCTQSKNMGDGCEYFNFKVHVQGVPEKCSFKSG